MLPLSLEFICTLVFLWLEDTVPWVNLSPLIPIILFQVDSWALRCGFYEDILYRIDKFRVSHSWHICGSLLVPMYCKKRLLWWGLSAALIYGYSWVSLGLVLLLCSFSWIVEIGFLLGSWPIESHGVGHICNVRYALHFMEWAWNTTRK